MADLTDAIKAWMQMCTEELEDEEALTCSECEFKAQSIEHLAEHKREAGQRTGWATPTRDSLAGRHVDALLTRNGLWIRQND